MANVIISSVARAEGSVERIVWGDKLHNTIAKFARASLYRNSKDINRLQKQIVRLAANDFFKTANNLGEQTARELTRDLEKRTVTDLQRRRSVATFNSKSAKNLKNLEDGIKAGGLRLQADTAETIRRARLGTETRRDVERRLAEADRAAMDSFNQFKKEHNAAVADETDALDRLSRNPDSTKAEADLQASRKEQKRVRRNMKARQSFLARFENKTQQEITDQYRVQTRLALDQGFARRGYGPEDIFVWVTVSGDGTCPDCADMHGETRPRNQFNGQEPGSGWSVCEQSCKCVLVPEQFSIGRTDLTDPLRAPETPRIRERQPLDVPASDTPLDDVDAT